MDFSLYEDFPLFSGDLLGSLSPQPDELPQEATDEWQLPFSHHADVLAKGWQEKQPKQEVKITIDVNKVNWIDTKVDLFDLIKPEEDVSSLQGQSSSPFGEVDISSSTIETDLSSSIEAEKLSQVSELLASDLQSLEYISPSNNNTISDQLSPDFDSLEYNTAVLGDEDINEEVDSILNNHVELLGAAPALSPVSTEDIDRVLQSEPSSPYTIVELDAASAFDSLENSIAVSPSSSSIVEMEDSLVTVDSSYLQEELLKPLPKPTHKTESRSLRPQRQKVRYDPYSPPDSPVAAEKSLSGRGKAKCSPVALVDSKSRKKQQNKDAALRYRLKKKQEKSIVMDECDQLEKKNDELRDKVDSMTREIKYLKDLLAEVYQAKPGFKSQKK